MGEPQQPDRRPALSRVRGSVVIEKISFGYQPDSLVLNNFSLTLRPGQVVGIVGSSGCGKSTLAKLVAGLYPPVQSSIRMNGSVAYVPQNAFVFDDTLYNNILCGNPQATHDEVVNAAVMAHADEFIRQLPNGYETRAGERGAMLSGGQAQRIALARAFLMNPDILVLDEPTSALDALSEKEVLEAMNRLMENRTTLLITHRMHTLRSADVVYNLETIGAIS